MTWCQHPNSSKKCKAQGAYPCSLLEVLDGPDDWKQDSTTADDVYQMQHVTPRHKGPRRWRVFVQNNYCYFSNHLRNANFACADFAKADQPGAAYLLCCPASTHRDTKVDLTDTFDAFSVQQALFRILFTTSEKLCFYHYDRMHCFKVWRRDAAASRKGKDRRPPRIGMHKSGRLAAKAHLQWDDNCQDLLFPALEERPHIAPPSSDEDNHLRTCNCVVNVAAYLSGQVHRTWATWSPRLN